MSPTPPAEPTTPAQDLKRFELLRAYKEVFHGKQGVNHSPFGEQRVVRYDTDIRPWDVPEIHDKVRDSIKEILRDLHAGKSSRIAILAGEPGMGKSHLLNYFRTPEVQAELGFVLVGNSNHWDLEDFEGRLLNAIVARLTAAGADGRSLLQIKVEEIAFKALERIVSDPEDAHAYLRTPGVRGWFSWRFADQTHKYANAIEKRDTSIFKQLDFSRFAQYVCENYLAKSEFDENPFHWLVLHMLLRFLFPEDRNWVRAWLSGQKVRRSYAGKLGPQFANGIDQARDPDWPKSESGDAIERKQLDLIGVADKVDCNPKIMDTIRILISLFAPAIGAGKDDVEKGGITFFLAFDQSEGRDALFENKGEWAKFFAKLSELFNSLPNMLVMFTMTTDLRDQLYPQMERQFQQRIHRDEKFVLTRISDEDTLALYRKHLEIWRHGKLLPEMEALCAEGSYRYTPFSDAEILTLTSGLTLRQMIETLDKGFRTAMLQVASKFAAQDFVTALNEERSRAEEFLKEKSRYVYAKSALGDMENLLNQIGDLFPQHEKLTLTRVKKAESDYPALQIDVSLHPPDNRYVRVFVVVFTSSAITAPANSCMSLIGYKGKDRKYIWFFRPEPFSSEKYVSDLQSKKEGHVFAQPIPTETLWALKALIHLADKREGVPSDMGISESEREKYAVDAAKLLIDELKKTQLGEIFAHARKMLSLQLELIGETDSAEGVPEAEHAN